MSEIWDEARLRQYIDNGIEESLNLDYKAAGSLDKSDGKKREITKDVSAMANSDGGIIIYGIAEYQESAKKHLAEKIDPIDRTQFSKEWLEQIINTIRPKIDGVIVHSVDLDSATNNVAYVVEIPQSNTAHQATDKRYYKRFNFLSEAMEDYEIRDVMGRGKYPKIKLEFEIAVYKTEDPSSDLLSIVQPPKTGWYLNIYVRNIGSIYAKYIHCVIQIPEVLLTNRERINGNPNLFSNSDGTYFYEIETDNMLRRYSASLSKISSMIYRPILPQTVSYLDSEQIGEFTNLEIANLELRWEVYADNAPINIGSIPLKEIPIEKE